MKNKSDIQCLAIFDYDGTIAGGNNGFSFILQCFSFSEILVFLLRNRLSGLLYLFHIHRNKHIKRIAYDMFANKSYHDIAQRAKQYAEGFMTQKAYPTIMGKINWHKKQGHHLILITRTFDVIVNEWAYQVGFDNVISIELEKTDNYFTGKIIEENIHAKTKLELINEQYHDITNYITYAYGNDLKDDDFLRVANHAYLTTKGDIEPIKAKL